MQLYDSKDFSQWGNPYEITTLNIFAHFYFFYAHDL